MAKGLPDYRYMSYPAIVPEGGLGVGTLTLNGVLLGNVTSPVKVAAAGAADQLLRVPAAGGEPAFGAVDLAKAAAVTGLLAKANGGWGSADGSFQGTIKAYVPDSATPNFQGWRTGDAYPSVTLTRRALILGNGVISPHMQLYHPSTGFVRLRNYSTDPTEGEALVFAIDANPTVGKEATLVLHVGVEADGQYLDFFNNTGYTTKRYGIRIQKRGTGAYYPFTFSFYDATTETEAFRVLTSPLGCVQFAQPVQVLAVAEYADNAAAVAAGLAVGTLYRTGDALKIVH